MKIGFLCSAGGSPLFTALEILLPLQIIKKTDINVLSDRSCEALDRAKELGLSAEIINWSNTENFSLEASKYFKNCDFIILLFSRLVDKNLFETIPTLNIHPSLLPSFKGFKALEQAIKYKSRFFGASLHLVNEKMDDGPLIAQTINPLPSNADLSLVSKISYLQKTYLILLIIDLMQNDILDIQVRTQSFVWKKETGFSQFANPILVNKQIQNEYDLVYHRELYGIMT